MDQDTKKEATKKLANMKQVIAYPDEFLLKEKVDGVQGKITQHTKQ